MEALQNSFFIPVVNGRKLTIYYNLKLLFYINNFKDKDAMQATTAENLQGFQQQQECQQPQGRQPQQERQQYQGLQPQQEHQNQGRHTVKKAFLF
jgi:hypothetical protein